jgi:hypothetical protein
VYLIANKGRWTPMFTGDISTTKLNSVALVLERTVLSEPLPLVGVVSANFCRYRVLCGQRDESPRPYSQISRPKPLPLLSSSSSVVLTRLSGPCSIPTTSQKIW